MTLCCGRSDASASNAAPINVDQETAMKKIISGVLMSLMTLPALAEEAMHAAPRVEADPTALIICAILLVGLFGGFFGYIIWRDRRDQEGKTQD
jgi:fluoride ion exporter CrcB/FEX